MVAIVKRPEDTYGEFLNIDKTLKNLQKTVGGYVEMVMISPDMVVLCDEDGRLKDKAFNMSLAGNDFVGTIIVCGIKDEEFCDVPTTEEKWRKVASYHRLFDTERRKTW